MRMPSPSERPSLKEAKTKAEKSVGLFEAGTADAVAKGVEEETEADWPLPAVTVLSLRTSMYKLIAMMVMVNATPTSTRLIAGPAKTCFAEVLDVRDDACMIVRDHALGSPRVATVGRQVEARLRLMLAGCAKLLVFKPSGEALAGVGRGQTAQRRSSSDGQTTDKMRRSDKMMRKLYL